MCCGIKDYIQRTINQVPLNYREVGLGFIPVDSRHVSELSIKTREMLCL